MKTNTQRKLVLKLIRESGISGINSLRLVDLTTHRCSARIGELNAPYHSDHKLILSIPEKEKKGTRYYYAPHLGRVPKLKENMNEAVSAYVPVVKEQKPTIIRWEFDNTKNMAIPIYG